MSDDHHLPPAELYQQDELEGEELMRLGQAGRAAFLLLGALSLPVAFVVIVAALVMG